MLTNSLNFGETFLQTLGLLYLFVLRIYWGNKHVQILEISNIHFPFLQESMVRVDFYKIELSLKHTLKYIEDQVALKVKIVLMKGDMKEK